MTTALPCHSNQPPSLKKKKSLLPPEFSADMLPIYEGGCIEAPACQNETNLSVLSVNYNITRHCCSTDLCNGAAAIRLPLTAALGAALVAVWSQWDHFFMI